MGSTGYNFQSKEALTKKANEQRVVKKYSPEISFNKLKKEIKNSISLNDAFLIAESFIIHDCDTSDSQKWWISPDELEKLIYDVRSNKHEKTKLKEEYSYKWCHLRWLRSDEYKECLESELEQQDIITTTRSE